MRKRIVGGVCLLVFTWSAHAAPVYRCEKDGTVTFTDQPCGTDASPYRLPDAVLIAEPTDTERELAERYEARRARDKAARDRADAEWLKNHDGRKDRDERVRAAIIGHEVVRGMSADEVRSALGKPDQVRASETHGTPKETWVYSDADGTRTVNFKDGAVTSTSVRGRTRK